MATPLDNIMSGTLDVSGQDEVDITLFGKPVTILVEFKDDGGTTPCDSHKDTLDWQVNFGNGSFMLKIKWNVSGVRTVSWAVDFVE
jgi:hypothetical protein